ncbi:resolvase [Niastella yeongjuensis]|uniref:Resolvase n=1 Tax=Niastella yeongjuensis TaxID=354355 RepID=A0A1V9F358_9BACT|nr:recombinase family protein [Niastella yeongjuensis]OQP52808.1 resolvase [Niastella yeongjuensis]SEP20211.1 Site-specific DNA recombinase [Niastella yeongjuensis]
MKLVIAYYRISTEKQGRSGLGLESQKHSVRHYCESNGFQLLMEIREVKSTRKRRIYLENAFTLCQKHNAALIVARLDRLGRDVEEIAHNIKLPVDIIVADNPHANRFTIHILAAVAEEQRRTISENTKLALQAAKKRGVLLGRNGIALAEKNKEAANVFAKKLQPTILKINAEGIRSTRRIASELNRLEIPTFRTGGRWHRTSVYNLLSRLGIKAKYRVKPSPALQDPASIR